MNLLARVLAALGLIFVTPVAAVAVSTPPPATVAPSELPWWAAPFEGKPFTPPYIAPPREAECHVKRHAVCTDALGNESEIV